MIKLYFRVLCFVPVHHRSQAPHQRPSAEPVRLQQPTSSVRPPSGWPSRETVITQTLLVSFLRPSSPTEYLDQHVQTKACQNPQPTCAFPNSSSQTPMPAIPTLSTGPPHGGQETTPAFHMHVHMVHSTMLPVELCQTCLVDPKTSTLATHILIYSKCPLHAHCRSSHLPSWPTPVVGETNSCHHQTASTMAQMII